MAPIKYDWRGNFITACIGLMTTGIIGSVVLLIDLKVAVVQNRQVDEQQSAQIVSLQAQVETVRNEVSANVLEIVRVRAQCERAWRQP